jgi:hypothetical protein
MTRIDRIGRRPLGWTLFVTAAVLALASSGRAGPGAATDLPDQLGDREFWAFSQDSSEPGGYFRAQDITNLTSNELWYQYVIPDLVARAGTGGVYLGVGPEQNFTYMAELRPKLAVIFDIRRGNLDLQLMYKAIFEMANDRADFVSMLFAKPRPAGLTERSTAQEIFRAFAGSATSEVLYKRHLAAIRERLIRVHGFALLPSDVAGVEAVYQAFYWNGFALRSSPTYADLMTATDQAGVSRSYLATEDRYRVLRDLEVRNLVVPVVGDFGGPKAIRAVGRWVEARAGTVSAFYLSNVEQYLVQDGKWDAFCRNVATLPLAASSTFIRSESGRGGYGRGFGRGGGFISSLATIAEDVKSCRARQEKRLGLAIARYGK